MGYYVTLEQSNACVQQCNIRVACKALMKMFEPETVEKYARGGSSSGEKWYSWLDHHNAIIALENNELAFFIEHWGFDTYARKNGDIVIYSYDDKSGQEEYMLSVLAPYIEDSEMIWSGEDGERWALVFRDGKMSIHDVELTIKYDLVN